MTHGHYPYAWEKEGRGMVVQDNRLSPGLESKKNLRFKLSLQL